MSAPYRASSPAVHRRCGIIAALAVATPLCGCLVAPEVMIVSSVAQAALKTGVRYAKENRPTPEQAWQADQLERLITRARAGAPGDQRELGRHYQSVGSAAALNWTCRAAHQGHPESRLQLGHWYNEDRRAEDLWPFIPVSTDDAVAYRWYRLAEAGGETVGGVYAARLALEDRLGAAAASRADEQIDAWKPTPCGGPTGDFSIAGAEDAPSQ